MPARMYLVNAHALDVIDTEAKAYLLGFIAADGYVSGDGLGFTLHQKDADILCQVKDVLGSTHPLRPIARDRLALDISSRPLAARLAELGLSGAKTTSVLPPVGISSELLPHWLRGYWDGDGWLTTRKRATGITPRVRVAGWSKPMMEFVQCLCSEYAGRHLTLGNYKGGWSVGMVGDSARRWIARVYLGATIGGQRKHALACELYGLPVRSLGQTISSGRRRKYRQLNAERDAEIMALHKAGWTHKAIGERFGISTSYAAEIARGEKGYGA